MAGRRVVSGAVPDCIAANCAVVGLLAVNGGAVNSIAAKGAAARWLVDFGTVAVFFSSTNAAEASSMAG